MTKKIFSILCLLLFSSLLFASEPLSFKKALKKYHRHGESFSFSTLFDNITWDVVYKSPEFREAATRKLAKDYRWTEDELKTKLWDEDHEAAKGPEFIAMVYTYHKTWNDLDVKDSIWKLRLEGDGKQFEAVSIVKIKPTPIDTSLYPFVDPWTKAYSVVFPQEAYSILDGNFSLSVFGVKGKNTLRWK